MDVVLAKNMAAIPVRRPSEARSSKSTARIVKGGITNPKKMWTKLKQFDPKKESAVEGLHYLFNEFYKWEAPTFGEFTKACNAEKNQSNKIALLDHSRVVLRDWSHDYIHASWVNGLEKESQFIAVGCPHSTSVAADFWHMCVQEKVEAAALLMRPDDDDAKYITASSSAGEYKIKADTKSDVVSVSISGKEKHSLKFFCISSWKADEKIPPISELQKLLESVTSQAGKGPIVVCCKTGTARTGSFLLYALESRRLSLKKHVKFVDTIQMLRMQRAHLLDTAPVFDAALEMLVECSKKSAE